MSLRLRLALAFLLLSALPLAGFALYSYRSSSAALRRMAEAEAESLARDLALRVGSAADEVDRGVRMLARLPAASWRESGPQAEPPFEVALAGLAPALRFIEGVSFVPEPPLAPEPPAAPVPGAQPAPAVAPVAPIAPVALVAPVPPTPAAPAGFDSRRAAVERGATEVVRERAAVEREAARVQQEAIRHELEQAREIVRRVLDETRDVQRSGAPAADLEAVLARKQLALAQLERMKLGTVPAELPPPAEKKSAGKGSMAGDLSCDVAAGDQVVGKLQAKVKAKELLRSVLAQTDRERGEIPFALDGENKLYVAEAEDAPRLEALPAMTALRSGGPPPARRAGDDWVVVTRQEPASGYRYGIARPLSAAMSDLEGRRGAQLHASAWRSSASPPSAWSRSRGGWCATSSASSRARRGIADGDLATRVPVTLERRARAAGRRSSTAWRSSSPSIRSGCSPRSGGARRRRSRAACSRPRTSAGGASSRRRASSSSRCCRASCRGRAGLDLAVAMTTATEVGGDYYDFLDAADGELVLAVGDATGHGAAAGHDGHRGQEPVRRRGRRTRSPAAFLTAANAAVHRMGLVRRAMALDRGADRGPAGRRSRRPACRRCCTSAPRPARSTRSPLAGTPLGARGEFPYAERTLELAPGDALLFLSDGLPELPNPAGEPYGYERLRAALRDASPPTRRAASSPASKPPPPTGAAAAPPPTT